MSRRGNQRSRMRRRLAKPIDQQTTAQALRGPTDTRQWVSYGHVSAGGDNQDIVTFDEEEGVPFVSVVLEPTKVPVYARVGGSVAGNGEGEWMPFVQGDEVLCVVPEGDEKAGVVIISRLNNQLDQFPMDSVAGQDPTANNFSFKRRRTPYVEELAGPYLVRSATTGALLSIDETGVITLKNGENAALQMSPDVIGFQGPSDEDTPPEFIFQADLGGKRVTLQMGDAQLMMNATGSDSLDGQTWLTSPNNVNVVLGPNQAAEHVLTLEAFMALMGAYSVAVTPAQGFVNLNLAVAAGGSAVLPASIGPLQTGLALAQQTAKPPPVGGIQLAPGLGAVMFLTG